MESNPVSIHAIHMYINLLQHHAYMQTPIVFHAYNYTYNSIFMSSQLYSKICTITHSFHLIKITKVKLLASFYLGCT